MFSVITKFTHMMQVVGHQSHLGVLVQRADHRNDVVDLIHAVDRALPACPDQGPEAIDPVLDLITVALGLDQDRTIHEVDLDQEAIPTKDEEIVEEVSGADTTIGVLIINLVSKIQGITIKEVEVVVIIIIGILGITTEIIEAEVDSPSTEVDAREDVSAEVVIGIIEIEGKENRCQQKFLSAIY